jgi:predicted PurR-regulated permease PerM
MKDTSGRETMRITVANRDIVRVIVVALGAFLGVQILSKLSHALILVFMSFFLTIAINPIVGRITRLLKSKSRVRATGAAYVMVMSVIIAFFALVIPPLVNQTREFATEIPARVREFQTEDTAVARFVRKNNLDVKLNEVVDNASKSFAKVDGRVFNVAGKVGSLVASIIAVLVMTFMMLIEGPSSYKRFWELMPDNITRRWQPLVGRMDDVIVGYVNGQLIIALIASTISLIVMLLLGVPNAVALAGIVFMVGLIPMIGNTIAAVVVVLIVALTSFKLAIILAIFFPIYQQVENATIQPYIQSKGNEMSALTVFIAALLGASAFGIFGAFLAIPVAGCLKIVLQDELARRRSS